MPGTRTAASLVTAHRCYPRSGAPVCRSGMAAGEETALILASLLPHPWPSVWELSTQTPKPPEICTRRRVGEDSGESLSVPFRCKVFAEGVKVARKEDGESESRRMPVCLSL